MSSQFAAVIKGLVAGLADVGLGVGVVGCDQILAFRLEVLVDTDFHLGGFVDDAVGEHEVGVAEARADHVKRSDHILFDSVGIKHFSKML